MKAYRSGGKGPLILSDVSGQPQNRRENCRQRRISKHLQECDLLHSVTAMTVQKDSRRTFFFFGISVRLTESLSCLQITLSTECPARYRISLIILTPMKILQRNLNRSTFVV